MTTTPDLSKSYAGTCQCCFNTQVAKKTGARAHLALVLHGYKRPGDGEIIGDCDGHGYEPFELSCERTKWLLGRYENEIVLQEAWVKSLQEDTVDVLRAKVRLPREKWKTHLPAELGRYETVDVPRNWVDPDRPMTSRTFESIRQDWLRGAEMKLRNLQTYAAFLRARIESWTYAPEKLVEHETFVREQERKTQAERAAVRAEKDWVKFTKNWATAWRYVGMAVNKHRAGWRNMNEYAIFGDYDKFDQQVEHLRSGNRRVHVTVGTSPRGRAVDEEIKTVERLTEVSLPPFASARKGRK